MSFCDPICNDLLSHISNIYEESLANRINLRKAQYVTFCSLTTLESVVMKLNGEFLWSYKANSLAQKFFWNSLVKILPILDASLGPVFIYAANYLLLPSTWTVHSADKSLARPWKEQANFSLRMAWISFGALPCRKKTSLLDVVEIVGGPDMLPSLFPSWSGYGLFSNAVHTDCEQFFFRFCAKAFRVTE